MPIDDFLSRFPAELPLATQRRDDRYRLRRDLVAVSEPTPSGLGDRAVDRLPAEGILICRSSDRALDSSALEGALPVYSLTSDGPPAVFTGQVLVRFAEHVLAEERREELWDSGYQISDVLSYAPYAAWVRARSYSASDSLAGIAALESLPEVVNVEPQMILPSSRR